MLWTHTGTNHIFVNVSMLSTLMSDLQFHLLYIPHGPSRTMHRIYQFKFEPPFVHIVVLMALSITCAIVSLHKPNRRNSCLAFEPNEFCSVLPSSCLNLVQPFCFAMSFRFVIICSQHRIVILALILHFTFLKYDEYISVFFLFCPN